MSPKDWTADPFTVARVSALHLEMRDVYAVTNESERYARWKETGTRDPALDAAAREGWMRRVGDLVARGVVVRRARIVSEPVTDYIRYEHAGTEANLNAGEQIRWLPRRLASDIALPGNGFWMFDHEAVRFSHFSGDGAFAGHELRTEPKVVELCVNSFETVWQRATPHEDYKVG